MRSVLEAVAGISLPSVIVSHRAPPPYVCRFLIEEGKAGQPKMMTVGLHCRLAHPGRVSGLAEFVDFAKKYGKDVWICTREEIADFWEKNHYPKGAGSPMKAEKNEDGDNKSEELTVEPLNLEEAAAAKEAEEEEEGDVI